MNNNTETQNNTEAGLNAGDIVEGSVTNITKFGAFVKLNNSEEGLIHISEIANEFVNNVEDFVKVGQAIKVLVLGRSQKNKLELSLKKLAEKTNSGSSKPKETVKRSSSPAETNEEPPMPKRPRKMAPVSDDFEQKIKFFLKKI